jgi:hypothetical protein
MKNQFAIIRMQKQLIQFISVLLITVIAGCTQSNERTEFELFLDQLDQTINQFVNGDDSGFKQAWSHTENITVAGGFGGQIVQGWETIGPRLSIVSASYANTQYSTDRIASRSAGDFGYVVQHEYFHWPGESEPYQQYRTTMLFRFESGEWKLFHRHADSQVVFQGRH